MAVLTEWRSVSREHVRLRQVDLLSRTVTRGGAVVTMIKIKAANTNSDPDDAAAEPSHPGADFQLFPLSSLPARSSAP